MEQQFMKQRSPQNPIGATIEMDREPMRETVKQGLGALTQMFLQQRERYLAQAASEMGLDEKEGWKADLDKLEFVRPAAPKRERKKLEIPKSESTTFLTDTVARPASGEEDKGSAR